MCSESTYSHTSPTSSEWNLHGLVEHRSHNLQPHFSHLRFQLKFSVFSSPSKLSLSLRFTDNSKRWKIMTENKQEQHAAL